MDAIRPSAEPIKVVDSTPDGGYALRILQTYRDECDRMYPNGGVLTESEALDLNERQVQRAAELDKAIETLIEADELRAKARKILTTLDAR